MRYSRLRRSNGTLRPLTQADKTRREKRFEHLRAQWDRESRQYDAGRFFSWRFSWSAPIYAGIAGLAALLLWSLFR